MSSRNFTRKAAGSEDVLGTTSVRKRKLRNITAQSQMCQPSNVYPIYPGNKTKSVDEVTGNKGKAQPKKQPLMLPTLKQLKTWLIESISYLEQRPGTNFGLFVAAQLIAGANLPSLIGIGVLVMSMGLGASRIWKSRAFVSQGLAICAGLGVARILQVAMTILL